MKLRLTALVMIFALGASAQWTPVKGRYNYTDSFRLGKYKNNSGLDSALVPDVNGILRLKKFTGGGTLQDAITAGSTLTSSNTITNTGHVLSITGGSLTINVDSFKLHNLPSGSSSDSVVVWRSGTDKFYMKNANAFTPSTPSLQAVTNVGATTTQIITADQYQTANMTPLEFTANGGSDYLSLQISGGSISGNWTQTLQQATGTIALTSDITSAVGAVGLQQVTNVNAATTNALTITGNAIGVTPTSRIELTNTTAATNVLNQYSPSLTFTGQGWKTNATAASRSVNFRIENQTSTGTANPAGSLSFDYQTNGGGYTQAGYIYSDGSLLWGQASLGAAHYLNISHDGNITTAASAVMGNITGYGGTIALSSPTQGGYVDFYTYTKENLRIDSGNTTLHNHLINGNDNTYDLGASGTNRFRTGYFGTSVSTPAITLNGTDLSTTLSTKLDDQQMIPGYAAAGSTIKAETFGLNAISANGSGSLIDGRANYQAVYVSKAITVTGIKFILALQGSYTGDNNNKVGLYSYASGTLTLIDTSANDANLYQTGATNTVVTAALTTTHALTPGLYYVALLHNNSAVVTAPAVAGFAARNAINETLDFTNSVKWSGTVSTQTNLPATQAMSGINTNTTIFYVMLY